MTTPLVSKKPSSPGRWLRARPEGLYVEPGDFFIDPTRVVERAVITHAHGDHARSGHRHVLATQPTLAIMRLRLGRAAKDGVLALAYGEEVAIGEVAVRLVPAGHMLGAAQVVMEHAGQRVVVSGDYKRAPDPTCAAFEPVTCDLFISEATFGLPVFHHPPAEGEILRLLASMRLFPEFPHRISAYGAGKAQRLVALLRAAGFDRPIHLDAGALAVAGAYRDFGVELGELRALEDGRDEAEVIIAAPGRLDGLGGDGRRMVSVAASGWMGIERFRRQAGVDLPLIISDHADWDEALATIQEVQAPEVWFTHGDATALIFAARKLGLHARALAEAAAA